MSEKLKSILLEMAKQDEQMRAKLASSGELFEGYHPEMEKVHNDNAERLEQLIDEHGWPDKALVGQDASYAAWLIVQHAIGKPHFQKKCLGLLKKEVEKGEFEPKLVAYLEDRINIYEGKPQIYGTQFDWDSEGQLSPQPIQNPDTVNQLRESVGLEPLEEKIQEMRRNAKQEHHQAPKNQQKREQKFHQWAKKVGWRK